MTQYQVQNQNVEIGGITRHIGDTLDETIFAPAPELTEQQVAEGVVAKSEIESLLSTGHIIAI